LLLSAILLSICPVHAASPQEIQESPAAISRQSGKDADPIKRIRNLAAQGSPFAQQQLGTMYLQGKGVPQDFAEAEKWLRLAAENSNVNAQVQLGSMYHSGIGVPKDHAESAKWFRMAAKQGNTFAPCMLGAIYAEGKGIEQDFVQAYMWLNLCASDANGVAQDTGIKLRDAIAAQMQPDQIEEAQQLTNEWKPVQPK
jgi:hypothetical protein